MLGRAVSGFFINLKIMAKDNITLICAVLALLSAIAIALISVLLNEYDIESGALWYIAQALLFAASALGLTNYKDIYKNRSQRKNDENN